MKQHELQPIHTWTPRKDIPKDQQYRCPICRKVFLGYRIGEFVDRVLCEQPAEPNQLKNGRRMVCGDPNCIEAATIEHWEASLKYYADLDARKKERESLARAQAELDAQEDRRY